MRELLLICIILCGVACEKPHTIKGPTPKITIKVFYQTGDWEIIKIPKPYGNSGVEITSDGELWYIESQLNSVTIALGVRRFEIINQ